MKAARPVAEDWTESTVLTAGDERSGPHGQTRLLVFQRLPSIVGASGVGLLFALLSVWPNSSPPARDNCRDQRGRNVPS